MRHFVTGLFGTEKTTLARAIAHGAQVPYVDFDAAWSYSGTDAGEFLRGLPPACVVDAIPFSAGGGWSAFNRWNAGSRARVTCTVCSEDEWEARNKGGHPAGRDRWRDFWIVQLPQIEARIEFYGTGTNSRPMSHLDFVGKVGYGPLLREHLGRAPASHDWRYQDIDSIGLTGYSGSAETWRRIEPLAEWRGARVLDLGCNHGYMLRKAQARGADPRGLWGRDASEAALVVARAANFHADGTATFERWTAGEPLPETDVALVLNALHHFEKPGAVLHALQAKLVILEAYLDQEELIRTVYPDTTKHPSARDERAIFQCRRAP